MCVLGYVCVGVWVCRCVGVWVYGCLCLVHGCMAAWVYGCMGCVIRAGAGVCSWVRVVHSLCLYLSQFGSVWVGGRGVGVSVLGAGGGGCIGVRVRCLCYTLCGWRRFSWS